jgi:regulator of protease activity HflC (stomatin/prohibitin superfamily)
MRKQKAAARVFQEQNVIRQQQVDRDEGEIEDLLAVALATEAPKDMPRYRPASPAPQAPAGAAGGGVGVQQLLEELKSSEELQLEKEPIQVRETGFWLWKQIIVPPNAYVVHTRAGRDKPVTIGLGKSFGYNPYTDAYLVVPAAMQTIGVVANCITKEKQGINILAYVQWQIDNFEVAYRKLDFSDSRDPLGIVNAQLREQAEAAIKDKISTMSVEEVLTDKAPIIEELTNRLKAVAEGRRQGEVAGDEGLGIKIVTFQIREALVSSQRLWQDLQSPFRHEQEKMARISHLTMQTEIRHKELETRQSAETHEAETMVEIERITQGKETESVEIRLTEQATRFIKEQEAARQKIALEEETTLIRQESEQRLQIQTARIEQERKMAALQRAQEERMEQARLKAEAETRQKTLQIEQELHTITEDNRLSAAGTQAKLEWYERDAAIKKRDAELTLFVQEQEAIAQTAALEARLARERQEHQAKLQREEEANRVKLALLEQEVALERVIQETRNMVSQADLASRFIEKLPEVAAQMPEIDELRIVQTGDGDALSAFVVKMVALAKSMGITLPGDK